MGWTLDEGLQKFRTQWLAKHPGATVYTIGDANHSTNPRVSQHAPDDGRSGGPGDTVGEVDAVDVMPGNGVTGDDLEQLFNDLRASRDPRILYVIYGARIVSSVVAPWKIRFYNGPKHAHVHLSVNDGFAANTAAWKIAGWRVPAKRIKISGELPALVMGMEDAGLTGPRAIARVQLMANWCDNNSPDLDIDGVYGPITAAKVARIMGKGNKGRSIGEPEYRRLFGIYAV